MNQNNQPTGVQGNLNINSTAQNAGNRNEVQFNQAGFPQLAIIAYGVINTVGGTTAVFDELAASPLYQVTHQPDNQGWTVVRNSAGSYTITHNIGNLKYLPMITNINPQAGGQNLNCTMTSTVLNVFARDAAAGTAADVNAFNFIIFAIP